ncbi:MAG: HNH endonuclease [Aquificota bacterium]|nr:MAG: HNH endonuclease [Aquificota bacterium]
MILLTIKKLYWFGWEKYSEVAEKILKFHLKISILLFSSINNYMKTWRQTKEYRLWRIKIIRRDKRCKICGSIKSRQAHHLNSGSFFPNERFLLENGICLCKDCHSQFHNNYKKSFREKCTKYDFDNFFQLVNYFKNIFGGDLS